MMTRKFFPGSSISPMFVSGLPSTRQQIGECAFLDDAELAGIGIAWA
jgi:hypothetical protein